MKNKFLNKSTILTFCAIVGIGIITLIIFWIYTAENKLIYRNYNFYQYLGGYKFNYVGKLTLTRKQKITELKIEKTNGINTITLDSTPLYFNNDKNKILFAQDVSVVYPMNNEIAHKINHFSTIEKDDTYFYVKNGNIKKLLNTTAFIYDGGDLYLFLQETKITVKGKEYTLKPFSYAVVNYNQRVDIYDFEKDSYESIETTEEVFAKTSSYTINMSIDSIKYSNKDQLLLKQIDVLKPIQ